MNTKLKNTAKLLGIATIMYATGFATAKYQEFDHVNEQMTNYATFLNNANSIEYYLMTKFNALQLDNELDQMKFVDTMEKLSSNDDHHGILHTYKPQIDAIVARTNLHNISNEQLDAMFEKNAKSVFHIEKTDLEQLQSISAEAYKTTQAKLQAAGLTHWDQLAALASRHTYTKDVNSAISLCLNNYSKFQAAYPDSKSENKIECLVRASI